MALEAKARKRNAAVTRDAILNAARRAFADAGYDGAGVREIAKAAGVTAMMVNHYFGSKEQLFAEVLTARMKEPDIVRPDVLCSPTCGHDLATALVAQTERGAAPLDGFLVLLKSVSSPRATEIGREQIERFHHKNVAEAIKGDSPAERAAVVLALVGGFQLMRQMFGLRALVDADPDHLVRILAAAFDVLIQGVTPT